MITISIKSSILTFILLLFITVSVSAQKLFLTPQEIFQEANEYLLSEEPAEALGLLLQLREKGYNSASVLYKTGKCYLEIPGKKENAVSYLEEAVKNISLDYNGNLPDEDRCPAESGILLGKAYRIANEFEKSINVLEQMISDSSLFSKNELAEIKRQIELSRNAQELVKARIDSKSDKLSDIINAGYSNTNPVTTNDESLLCYIKHLKFYDAIMRSVKVNGNWDEPENLIPEIKSDGDFLITGISADGSTLYLRNYDPYTNGDIYSTHTENGKWSPIEKLNNNINTQYNETHASLSKDGKTLYFTSNRPGGYGGLDIYKSVLDENNDWGPAINLGPVINTKYDEESPFKTPDSDLLFFSSQGHYNMGGFDIFYSRIIDSNQYETPLNIGFPVNTSDDDVFYCPVKNGKTGFIARFDNNTYEHTDIYRYEILSDANPARFTVKGLVELPEGSSIKKENIRVTFIDETASDTVGTNMCDTAGRFSYPLPAGKFTLGFSDHNRNLCSKQLNIPVYMPPGEFIFNTELVYNKEIKTDTLLLRSILFGFDKFQLSAADLTMLDQVIDILKKYPGITLQIAGHTDAIGKTSYNRILSEKRAREVLNYLVQQGISSKKLTFKGYGEDNPVAKNTNADGTDNPEGRKFNRRVEIIPDNIPDNIIVVKIPATTNNHLINKK